MTGSERTKTYRQIAKEAGTNLDEIGAKLGLVRREEPEFDDAYYTYSPGALFLKRTYANQRDRLVYLAAFCYFTGADYEKLKEEMYGDCKGDTSNAK